MSHKQSKETKSKLSKEIDDDDDGDSPAPAKSKASTASETISVPKDEWETMKEQLATMGQQLKAALTMIPAAVAPIVNEEPAVSLIDKTPCPAGLVRRLFKASLPHCKPVVMSVDVTPGMELGVRSQVEGKYYKHFGILSSVHPLAVQEVSESVEANASA